MRKKNNSNEQKNIVQMTNSSNAQISRKIVQTSQKIVQTSKKIVQMSKKIVQMSKK